MASRPWPARAAKAKAKARKGASEVNAVMRRVWTGMRKEHTLVNLFSPPESDEPITEMQVIHIPSQFLTPLTPLYIPLQAYHGCTGGTGPV